jgi:hypothetical protein
MGITQADFRRVFPRLANDGLCRWMGPEVYLEWPTGAGVTVRLSAERVRQIASLRIPCLDVSFEFHGLPAAQCEDFLRRFDQAFHKGGG